MPIHGESSKHMAHSQYPESWQQSEILTAIHQNRTNVRQVLTEAQKIRKKQTRFVEPKGSGMLVSTINISK